MENYQMGAFGQESQTTNTGQEFGHPVVNSTQDDFTNTISDFYDESGNYRSAEFESLGGLHYMNYLHSHDDML